MPIYEYECKKCGTVSSFYEKVDEWGFWRRKCENCGSRKLKKVLSSFTPSASRSSTETLNELKQMGNVQFVPKHVPPWGTGPPPGGCPYENMEKEAEKKEKAAKPGGTYTIKE